jgi:hypothetical protein
MVENKTEYHAIFRVFIENTAEKLSAERSQTQSEFGQEAWVISQPWSGR